MCVGRRGGWVRVWVWVIVGVCVWVGVCGRVGVCGCVLDGGFYFTYKFVHHMRFSPPCRFGGNRFGTWRSPPQWRIAHGAGRARLLGSVRIVAQKIVRLCGHVETLSTGT